MHPWHDVELGKDFPEILRAVIEIPKGANAKYKLDAKTGMIKLSEFLPTVARYPANYGFFPRTVEADGDALDVFVFGREPVVPLTLLEVRPLGAVAVHSAAKGKELKLIAVCPGDPEFQQYKSIEELPRFYLDELTQFFEVYKALDGEKKKVKRVYGRKATYAAIRRSADDYARKFNLGKLEAA
jgi:inorganic pyrophosphatase